MKLHLPRFALTLLFSVPAGCLADTFASSGWCSPILVDVKGDVLLEVTSDAPQSGLIDSKPGSLSATSSKDLNVITKRDLSPVMAHIGGSVHIVCNGVNPAALKAMNLQLENTKQTLGERTRAADAWANQYFALKRFLETADLPPDVAAEADRDITTGQLEKAEALFYSVTQTGQRMEATGLYGSAQVHRLQGRNELASREFRQAYEANPAVTRYALAFGASLQESGDLTQAELVYRKAFKSIVSRDMSKFNPLDPDPLFLAREKLVANLCGIDLSRGALDALERDQQMQEDMSSANCFEVDQQIMSRLRDALSRQQGPPSPDRSASRLTLLSYLVQQQILLTGHQLVYVRAFQSHPGTKMPGGGNPFDTERIMLRDNIQFFQQMIDAAADAVKGRPDARLLMEPYVRQETLAWIELTDAECSPEQRPAWLADSARVLACLSQYEAVSRRVSSLNTSTLVSVGPARLYLAEMVFRLSVELLQRNKAGRFEFAGHDVFDRCVESREKSLQEAREVFRQLTSSDDPELNRRYPQEYARFLQEAIATLRAGGRSGTLKDLQKEAAKLPKPPRTGEPPPARFNQPRWIPFFSDTLPSSVSSPAGHR